MARVLGRVQVVCFGNVLEPPSASQRRLLAALAIHAPQPVRAEWLCGVLDLTPGALRKSVARLRKVVGDQALRTRATGYQFDAAVDATLAESEYRDATHDPVALAALLERWDGPSIAEFAAEPWAVGTASRLDELHASIVESFAAALLNHDRVDEAIGVLEGHVADHPFRDHPQGLLIRGFAVAGRSTEALRVFQSYRRFLADEVGVEPSAALQEIERRVSSGWDGRLNENDANLRSNDAAVTHRRRATWSRQPQVPDLLVGVKSVGREGELATLISAADSVVEEGRLRVALVSGEAGIGKTTLVAEFMRRLRVVDGLTVWYSRNDELAAGPLQPFRGLLEKMVEALPEEVLSAHVAARGNDVLPMVPHLKRLLPGPTVKAGADEITARHLLFEATADLVRRSAEVGPLIIVLDDMHWAEPTGLQLLRHLVRNLAGSPILFAVCFRDTGEADRPEVRLALAELVRSGAVRIELGGLGVSALGDLVLARTTSLAGYDVSAVVDLLGAESGGNPLYAEHLLQHWDASGGLQTNNGSAVVAPRTNGAVPANLRDLVWDRVAPLGPDGETVLCAAAVLGIDVDEAVLVAVTDLSRRELGVVLDRAVTAGLLEDHPSQRGVVRFAHALVARAIDGDLGARERSRLHESAYEVLLASPSHTPAQLAHHAARAGLPNAALDWSIRAGERALVDLTPDEAAVWFGRALRHAEEIGVDDIRRAAVMTSLGEAAYRAGHPTAIDTLHQAAELALSSDADDVLLRAAFTIAPGSIRLGVLGPKQVSIAEAAVERTINADDDSRARALAMLARSLVSTDQRDRRTAAATEAEALARASKDASLLARIAPDLLFSLWAPGAGESRLRIARDAVEIIEDSGQPLEASNLYHAAHTAAVCAGDQEFATHCADRLQSLAEEINEPRVRWLSALIEGFDATMECRFDEAEELIPHSHAIGAQIGESEAFTTYAAQFFTLGSHRGHRGEMLARVPDKLDTTESVERTFAIAHAIACLDVGRPDVARAVLDEALGRGLEAVPADFMWTTLVIGLAILALGLDDVSAAEIILEELEPYADEVSFNAAMSQGPISIYVGRLATLVGRFDDAERHLHDALSVAKRFDWHYHSVVALCGLVENRMADERPCDESTSRWLSGAERLCSTYGITGWARRVADLNARIVA